MNTIAILAAAGSLALATAAAADPLDPRPGAPGGHGPVKVLVIVSSHGLDLSSATGADQFLQRLDSAVDRACDDRPAQPLAIGRSQSFYSCRSKALELAMTYVHSPVVKQRYAQLHVRDAVRLARR